MQRTSDHPTIAPETADGFAESALRAEAWAGEPFMREGEDPDGYWRRRPPGGSRSTPP